MSGMDDEKTTPADEKNRMAASPPEGESMGRKTNERKPYKVEGEGFSIYPTSDGTAWKSFRFNADVANRGGMKSIAEAARRAGYIITDPITNKLKAIEYVKAAISKGIIKKPQKNTTSGPNPVLRDFVRDLMQSDSKLFKWLQGDPRTAIGLKRFKSYCSSFKLHGYDALPAELTVSEATKDDMKSYLRTVRSETKSEEVEFNCLQAVRKTYSYAKDELRIAEFDPTEGLKVKRKSRIEREILLPDELRALLAELELEAASDTESRRAYSKRIYVAVWLMVHTGMRGGEIRALRIEKVKRLYHLKKPTKIFKLRVDSNWDDGTQSIKPPKNNKPRPVYVWEDTAKMLLDLYDEHRNPNGFIFPGNLNPERPIDKSLFYDYVYRAMRTIGISDDERVERHIDMHSIRSFYITQAEAIAMYQHHKEIMDNTGHLTEAAHSRYVQYTFLKAYHMACLSRDLLKEDEMEEVCKDALVEDGRPLFYNENLGTETDADE